MLQYIFRGRRSAWFPLLTARQRRLAELDTSVICHAVLIHCLGFVSIARYVLRPINMLLFCILFCDTRPSYLIRTVCEHSVRVAIVNIIFILTQLRDCHSFTLRKLYVFLETLLRFLHQSERVHSKEK